jgi:hypothetical protein
VAGAVGAARNGMLADEAEIGRDGVDDDGEDSQAESFPHALKSTSLGRWRMLTPWRLSDPMDRISWLHRRPGTRELRLCRQWTIT